MKKLIIRIVLIIGAGIIAYHIIAVVCILFIWLSGWGSGPFHAVKIEPVEISDSAMRFQLSNTKNTDPIEFSFTGYWTYGAEPGHMKINRKNGKNKFYLSW